jgi:hypothetical protein
MADEKEPDDAIPYKEPDNDPYWRWLKLAAPYCDTWAVDAWPTGVVRLTFAEFTGKGYLPFFRSAVVMPHGDAKDFARAILEEVQKIEKPATEPSKKAET